MRVDSLNFNKIGLRFEVLNFQDDEVIGQFKIECPSLKNLNYETCGDNANMIGRHHVNLFSGESSNSTVIGKVNLDFMIITGLAKFNSYQLTAQLENGEMIDLPHCAKHDHFTFESQCQIKGAHRGSGSSFKAVLAKRSKYRENTIESFNQAAANGLDMIEFDVQLTKDNVPVVYHDLCLGVDNQMTTVSENYYQHLVEAAADGNIQSMFSLLGEAGPMMFDVTQGWEFPKLVDLFEKCDDKLLDHFGLIFLLLNF